MNRPSERAIDREMNQPQIESGPTPASARRKWQWIGAAAGFCAISWIALGVGIALDAGTGTMIVLASLAALTTEGTIWLAALMLGLSAYQVRRQLWENVRRRFR